MAAILSMADNVNIDLPGNSIGINVVRTISESGANA
jgi:hypothetical protein